MLELRTERLRLIPCTIEIGKAILSSKDELKNKFNLITDEDWPLEDIKGFLPIYLEMLGNSPQFLGWGIWLIILESERRIIGDVGYKGTPEDGSIEIGYSIVPKYRRRGLTFEAVKCLIDWGFTHPEVNKIVAECERDNIGSIRILEKLGMIELNIPDYKFKHYELSKVFKD